MSGLYPPKIALQKLETSVERLVANDINIYFVVSNPRSDMGKGTLVAHLLRILPESDAIKFDGLLNTNTNGRHTARGHDDFGTYERYNPGRKFGDEHYILGGYLYKDFIDKYGEYENLTLRPYMTKHFISTIGEMWATIGKPKNLIVELGGTISDFEVDPYVTPAIRELKEHLGHHCQVILLTESGFNNEYIKTKTVQDSVNLFLQRRIAPDILLVREPSELQEITLSQRLEFERTITNKLTENCGTEINRILSVPFFTQATIDDYGDFLDTYLLPMLRFAQQENYNMKQVLVGSSNASKVQDWRAYLDGSFEVISPSDRGIDIEVHEGMTSLQENAIAKARAYTRASGLPSLSDDTGFFMVGLGGAPGVAVKRWNGELPETTTGEEFLAYLKAKIKHLDDTSCYFETVFALALPSGTVQTIKHQTHGYIDKTLLDAPYAGGFPLGTVFKKPDRDKVWNEMTDDEKRASDADLVKKVKIMLINTLG